MATSYRVASDQFSDKCEVYIPKGKGLADFIVDEYKPNKWRIYEYSNEFTSTSGGYIKRGKVVKRYDAEAGTQEGRIAQFSTKEAALFYCSKYLDPANWRK